MTAIQQSLTDEARRLLAAADARGLTVRVLGGAAIRLLLGERLHPALARDFEDIDLIVPRRDAPAVEALIADHGWQPEREFNAINGRRRLLFTEPGGPRRLDAFVEEFEMCHRLPLVERVDTRAETLPPAELLMTKLQIVELNAKDRGDCYALLLGCPAGDSDDGDALNVARIAELTARDWGLQHTFELNLDRLGAGLAEVAVADDERGAIRSALERIARAMDDQPKSRAWRLRARVGERKRWYEQPEEVDR